MEVKNNAQRSYDEVLIEDGFYVLKFHNEEDVNVSYSREINKKFIQFHFCLKGKGTFSFNQGSYSLNVTEENSLLLYNMQLDLPLDLKLEPKSSIVSVVMTLRKFHSLFTAEADYIPFLSTDNKEKKYYAQEPFSPSIAVILSQIINYNLHPSIKALYVKGKIYELIALYFNRSPNADIEQCPYLADEENVKKIKRAKDIILANMAEPPTLTVLASEVGISLKRLKDGFKQIYGDSVYSFLFDHKMDYAKRLLETGQYNVNEIGLKVGYSTASHFIAAFKKKYNTTPKKYLIALTGN
ncbi:AraC family transcriptional regulator [uncultured Maribacter sp.]|uniref:helix-turn-helix transcriptional regulator n=1 Tax=uncultured Maribacter sp. TaxID=431308 RepID=UPI0030D96CC4|tara:strand:+ start:110 stop:1000 length:891 start_codon:yes stop_codon:yes gene_type:complete